MRVSIMHGQDKMIELFHIHESNQEITVDEKHKDYDKKYPGNQSAEHPGTAPDKKVIFGMIESN